MVIAVPQANAQQNVDMLNELGEQAWVIGEIKTKSNSEDAVELVG